MEIPVPTPPLGDPAAAQPGTTTPPVPTPPSAADPPTANATPAPSGGDEPLGEGGKKALDAERAHVKELEKQLKTLAPLQKLAEALGAGDPATGKSEVEQVTERLAAHESELAKERGARWRAEIAIDQRFQFTPEQAAELRGDTLEELVAHAERLKTLFPPPAEPQTPRWGPSDAGPRNTQPQKLADQIAEAEKNKDFRLARSLKAQQLADLPKTN